MEQFEQQNEYTCSSADEQQNTQQQNTQQQQPNYQQTYQQTYGQQQYNPNYPPYGYQPEPPKKEKKDRTGLKLTAIIVVVAILASAGGVGLTELVHFLSNRNSAKTESAEPELAVTAPAEEKTQEDEDSATEDTESDAYALDLTPLPDTLKSNDGDKDLTAAEVYKQNVNACVGIATQVTTNVWGQTTTASCAGSGFILTEDGYVITNNHVIEDANDGSIKVKLYDGTEYTATVVGADEMNDVALLKVDATGLQAVTIGNSDELEVGEGVVAIGNPLGMLTFTMTVGYVSALDREINADGTPMNMLQTDVAINSGNSGGPLFDMNGNVIGITTAKYSGSTSSGTSIEGIGFAIPINDALKVVYDLQQYGRVTGRAYLGITLRNLDSTVASTYNLPVGPMVSSINEGSCSEAAGVQLGDIVTKFNGTDISTYNALVAALAKCKAGDTVSMTVYRSGAELELSITLDERPSEEEVEASENAANQQTQQNQQSQQNQQGQTTNPYGSYGSGNSGSSSSSGSSGSYGYYSFPIPGFGSQG